jgi:hypothetical protein
MLSDLCPELSILPAPPRDGSERRAAVSFLPARGIRENGRGPLTKRRNSRVGEPVVVLSGCGVVVGGGKRLAAGRFSGAVELRDPVARQAVSDQRISTIQLSAVRRLKTRPA